MVADQRVVKDAVVKETKKENGKFFFFLFNKAHHPVGVDEMKRYFLLLSRWPFSIR